MRRFQTILLVIAACMIASCAGLFGIPDGTLDNDASSPDAAIEDAVAEGTIRDAITTDVNTAVCDGGVPLVAETDAVWVSQSGLDQGSCGTKTSPCQTIKQGLARLTTTQHTIYVEGTFPEVVSLDVTNQGLTIQGGWHYDKNTSAWSTECTSTLATIVAPDTAAQPYAVSVGGNPDLTLRFLTIQSKNISGVATGASVIALLVSDSKVNLDGVTLVAQNGADGTPGTTPGPTVTPCSTLNAGQGGIGGTGNPSGLGSYLPDGFHGQSGSVGNPGDWGTATGGSMGACATCTQCKMNAPIDSGPTCTTQSIAQQCGDDGGMGCAGPGGNGGSGGLGGGAAIALYIAGVSPTVTMTAGGFVVGSGGTGGGGGKGQSGAAGGVGTTGAPYFNCGQGACVADGGFSCMNANGIISLEGGAGGAGGMGGTGGVGGGGAGGPVFWVATNNASNIVLTTTQLTLANSSFVGAPGKGGQPNGKDGDAGQVVTYP